MKRRLLALIITVSLLATAAISAAAAPTAGPCVAGGSYNPACDVDHNGIIDVLDIQLAAGHWNQTGAFTSGSWDLAGNAGTTPGASFLGTVDNQALEVKVNGQRALRIEPGAGLSPNLLGGNSGNYVSPGVVGGVIAGGGQNTYPNTVNRVTDEFGFIGGGFGNQTGNDSGSTLDAGLSTVSGGQFNNATGGGATVGGGGYNTASGASSTVAGGYQNGATDFRSTVGGGSGNTASSEYSTVAGGGGNTASGYVSTVAGGGSNTASGNYSTVAGGDGNLAGGSYSFAAGRRAKANNTGAFVLADSRDFDFTPSTNNAFTARFTGGARFILGIDGTGASTWICAVYNGGSWGCSSDRNVKENFQPVDGKAILAKLADLPITTWNAIGTDPNVHRMGPMAQDFYAAFGLGDDDKVITTGDLDGVALASIQGLYQMVQERDAQLAAQQQQIDRQQARLDEQQAQIEKLIARLTALEQGSTTAP